MEKISLQISGGTPPYFFLWNNGDTTVSIENLTMGNYEVIVTDGNGCTASNAFEVELVSGNDDIEMNRAFTVSYIGSELVFKFAKENTEDAVISLYNIGGQRLHQWKKGQESEVNILHITSGMYLVEVVYSDGMQRWQKVVVSR